MKSFWFLRMWNAFHSFSFVAACGIEKKNSPHSWNSLLKNPCSLWFLWLPKVELVYTEVDKLEFWVHLKKSRRDITPSVRLPARNDTRWKNEIFRAGRMKCNAHRADVWNCQVYALFPDACASAQVLPPVLLNVCLDELLIFNKIQTKSEHKRPIKGNISTYTNHVIETLCALNDSQTPGMSRVHYICNRKRNIPYSTWTCYVSNNSDKTPLLFTRNLSK